MPQGGQAAVRAGPGPADRQDQPVVLAQVREALAPLEPARPFQSLGAMRCPVVQLKGDVARASVHDEGPGLRPRLELPPQADLPGGGLRDEVVVGVLVDPVGTPERLLADGQVLGRERGTSALLAGAAVDGGRGDHLAVPVRNVLAGLGRHVDVADGPVALRAPLPVGQGDDGPPVVARPGRHLTAVGRHEAVEACGELARQLHVAVAGVRDDEHDRRVLRKPRQLRVVRHQLDELVDVQVPGGAVRPRHGDLVVGTGGGDHIGVARPRGIHPFLGRRPGLGDPGHPDPGGGQRLVGQSQPVDAGDLRILSLGARGHEAVARAEHALPGGVERAQRRHTGGPAGSVGLDDQAVHLGARRVVHRGVRRQVQNLAGQRVRVVRGVPQRGVLAAQRVQQRRGRDDLDRGLPPQLVPARRTGRGVTPDIAAADAVGEVEVLHGEAVRRRYAHLELVQGLDELVDELVEHRLRALLAHHRRLVGRALAVAGDHTGGHRQPRALVPDARRGDLVRQLRDLVPVVLGQTGGPRCEPEGGQRRRLGPRPGRRAGHRRGVHGQRELLAQAGHLRPGGGVGQADGVARRQRVAAGRVDVRRAVVAGIGVGRGVRFGVRRAVVAGIGVGWGVRFGVGGAVVAGIGVRPALSRNGGQVIRDQLPGGLGAGQPRRRGALPVVLRLRLCRVPPQHEDVPVRLGVLDHPHVVGGSQHRPGRPLPGGQGIRHPGAPGAVVRSDQDEGGVERGGAQGSLEERDDLLVRHLAGDAAGPGNLDAVLVAVDDQHAAVRRRDGAALTARRRDVGRYPVGVRGQRAAQRPAGQVVPRQLAGGRVDPVGRGEEPAAPEVVRGQGDRVVHVDADQRGPRHRPQGHPAQRAQVGRGTHHVQDPGRQGVRVRLGPQRLHGLRKRPEHQRPTLVTRSGERLQPHETEVLPVEAPHQGRGPVEEVERHEVVQGHGAGGALHLPARVVQYPPDGALEFGGVGEGSRPRLRGPQLCQPGPHHHVQQIQAERTRLDQPRIGTAHPLQGADPAQEPLVLPRRNVPVGLDLVAEDLAQRPHQQQGGVPVLLRHRGSGVHAESHPRQPLQHLRLRLRPQLLPLPQLTPRRGHDAMHEVGEVVVRRGRIHPVEGDQRVVLSERVGRFLRRGDDGQPVRDERRGSAHLHGGRRALEGGVAPARLHHDRRPLGQRPHTRATLQIATELVTGDVLQLAAPRVRRGVHRGEVAP